VGSRQLTFMRFAADRSLRLCVSSEQFGYGGKTLINQTGMARHGRAGGVGQFDCGQIVNWKTDSPKRILGVCQNPVIDPVSAARFMTAASTW